MPDKVSLEIDPPPIEGATHEVIELIAIETAEREDAVREIFAARVGPSWALARSRSSR